MKLLRIPGSVFILLLSFLAMSLSASVPFAYAAAGKITEFPVPTALSQLAGITLGPDGKIWFTEATGNQIGRITPSGIITVIASGSGNKVWFIEFDANQIGRINTK